MNEDEHIEKAPLFAAVRPFQFGQVLLVGALVGAFCWILAHVFGLYVLKPTSCTGEALACAATSQPAAIVATLIAACIGLLGLVKLQVFRPLLIVIAATASLWGVVGILGTGMLPWYFSLVAVILLHGLAYTTMMWIARIRLFWLAVLISLVLVVALRLIINA